MFGRQSIARTLLKIESFVGMLFAWFVGLLMIFFIAVAWFNTPGVFLFIAAAPVAMLAMAVELSMFAATWQAQYDRDSLAIAAASRVPVWPKPLRPVVCLWWLVHFFFGVAAAVAIEVTSTSMTTARQTGMPPPAMLFTLSTCFGLTFAGNVFLTLAVANITRRESVLRKVWAARLLIDAAVLVVPAIFALRGSR